MNFAAGMPARFGAALIMNQEQFNQLVAKGQGALAEFLKADLSAGITFAQLAQTERELGDEPAADRASNLARQAYDTTLNLLPRAAMLTVQERKKIEGQLERLRGLLPRQEPSR